MANATGNGRREGYEEVLPIPNLVKLQLDSYEWFLKEGLRELFQSFSPIEDFTGKLSLEFLDYSIGEPKYPVQECRDRDVSYEAPLKVRVMLINKESKGEIKESEVYLGELPLMTERGTFIINGAERVVVSQLARSPGVYFRDSIDISGSTLHAAQCIPSEGAWVEFDIGSDGVISVRIGQTKKFPVTTLLRAFEFFEEAMPGPPESREVNPQTEALEGRRLADRVVDIQTGEILGETDQVIDAALADRLRNAEAISPVRVQERPYPCATTPDLIRLFGEERVLGEFPRYAEDVEGEEEGSLLYPAGEEVRPEHLETLEELGYESLRVWTPEQWQQLQRLEQALQKAEADQQQHQAQLEQLQQQRAQLEEERVQIQSESEEWELEKLRDFVQSRALTVENLIQARSLLEVRVPGEVEPLLRPYQRISYVVAQVLVEMELETFPVVVLDAPLEATLAEDPIQDLEEDAPEQVEKAVLEAIYRILRPGEPPSQESGRSLLRSTFFDIRRYDLARVGRFKINKKLGLNLPLEVRTLTKLDLIAIIAYLIALHQRSGTPGTRIERIFQQLSGNPELALEFEVDDIDHLENKRVRAVGELLQNTLRLGFLRMERVARERMTSLEAENTTPQAIISIKPITAAIKSFFGSGALSQFMDQTNPLSELAHKRRLSAMGPGGLSRQSAKLEVRDVHRSHYGRICPIMTPEGPNIGLIGSLAMYARVDEFGFLETPYRRVRRGVASRTVVWLKADEEARYAIAPANVPLDENGRIIPDRVICRKGDQFPLLSRNEIELMDVSPKQIFSTATSLIPFLENDDANRALMGSNMQRQAVPLVRTDAPLVKTGIERRVAVDSGAVVVAGLDGVVTRVTANEICIQGYDGREERHALLKFMRTNQATFINQKPLVRKGQHVTAGQPIADGSCTDQGELALGRNVLVAFMPWEGYNYEDAIILSERMVRDDVFTSIHIDKYELQARETKLGPEEITGDIPNVGEEMLRNLDERGIIRVGVEIHPEDILVGKVAPKGQAEMTAEEKLVIAIFGKKAEEMRDTSLRVPHGAKGKVVDVKVFSRYKFVCQRCQTRFDFARSSDLHECEKCGGELVREQGDELPPGINQLVRVYVAQRRKIMEGDKMAGRHGNKGVIAKILPLEDMPHLPDGRPVDIILNPLGVPSRMNIGQILETHLGWVARAQGRSYENPVFQSMKEEEILAGLAEVTEKQRESVLYDYLSTEIPKLEEFLPPGATSGELLDILRSYLAGLPWEELVAQVRHFAAGPRYDLAEDVPHPHRRGVFLGRQQQPITEALLQVLLRYGVETVALRDARGQEATRPVREVLAELQAVEEHFSAEELIDFLVDRIQANVLERVGFDPQTGKCVLYDGRTGEPFRQPVCIGEIYMMKLHHLVDDKIHARSTGPYSLVTQQPLGGKAQFGGQRFGEMEVWALEAYGAAYTLQEILTIKSDDVLGRVKTYENIVKGENILEPGIPESFKILIKELQSLGLQVTVKSREGEAMDLRDAEEQ